MKTFILNLQFIFKPDYWLMNESYCKHWDSKLNELLDKYEFTKIGDYTANLGENSIWIENQPYATMIPYNGNTADFRASRLTIQKALRKLNEVQYDEKINVFKEMT